MSGRSGSCRFSISRGFFGGCIQVAAGVGPAATPGDSRSKDWSSAIELRPASERPAASMPLDLSTEDGGSRCGGGGPGGGRGVAGVAAAVVRGVRGVAAAYSSEALGAY